MNALYESYKALYINISAKYLEIVQNEEEILIQKKIFKNKEENDEKIKDNYKIELYFNKLGKANLMKSYFYEFIPSDIDKYFVLTKFRKILGQSKKGNKDIKLSKLYYKEINPIFDEMIDQLPKIKNHFEQLKTDIIDKNEIKIYNNIGKYFYYHFISPKISDIIIQLFIYIQKTIMRLILKKKRYLI